VEKRLFWPGYFPTLFGLIFLLSFFPFTRASALEPVQTKTLAAIEETRHLQNEFTTNESADAGFIDQPNVENFLDGGLNKLSLTSPTGLWKIRWTHIAITVLLTGLAVIGCRWYYTGKMRLSLRTLEDRYEPIVKLSNQLFYDYNVTTGMINWVGAILNITGWKPEEFVQMDLAKWASLIHPDDIEETLDDLEKARCQVGNYRVKYKFWNKNRGYIHVEDEGLFFSDKSGVAFRMLGTMKDISEGKEAEQLLSEAHESLRHLNINLERRVHRRTSELTIANRKLSKSEERFRNIFEYVTTGMCLASVEGRYLMVNRALCAMLGYSEDELLEKTYLDLTDPQDIPLSDKKLERLLAGEQPSEVYEKRYLHKNGRSVWATVGYYLLHDSKGRPQHFIAHIQDITRRKLNELSLNRLNSAIEQSAEGIVIINTEGIIEYVNSAFKNTFGYPAKEVLGQHSQNLDIVPDNSQLYDEIREALGLGQIWTGQVEGRKKNGTMIMIEGLISPIIGNNGQNIGFAAAIRDITEKRRLENRLKQAQKMEAIGTLAGGIAHDFNNILGGIIGCSEMAMLTIPPDSVARFDLEKVLEAGMRAKSLIKQILTFNRQSESEMLLIDLSVVLKEAVKLLSVSFPPGMEVRFDMPSGIGSVKADPVQMQQVLMNLCTNAMHAMGANGGLLQVMLSETTIDVGETDSQAELTPGHYLRLTVSDTGSGIPENIIESVFDPFFTTKKVGEGTVLGLSVVHGIVERHNGAITVESLVGAGTTFQVFIPQIKDTVIMKTDADSAPLPRGSERILLVDDEKLIFDVLPRMLKELGYDTVATSNGTDAYELFCNRPDDFDLVFTDQTMKDMTGIDLSRRITQKRPHIPIILCTGFRQPLSPEEAESIGIRAVLHKPVLRSTVATTIRRVLDDNGNHQPGKDLKGAFHG
jgi:PAS domain S-box-containing protein